MSTPTPPHARGASSNGAGVSRRSVVRQVAHLGLGAGIAAVLAGCGVRLDLPQPAPPVPTRRRAPDEALLVAVAADLRGLVDAERAMVRAGSGGSGGPVIPALLRLHERQLTVVTGRLTNAGVPTAEITASAKTTVGPTATGSTTPTGSSGTPSAVTPANTAAATPRTTAQLAARLDDLQPGDYDALASAGAPTRVLLTSAYAARLAGAVRLGRDLPLSATPSPARERIVERTRPLVYALEVVAAQSQGGQRERALDSVSRLRALEVEAAAASTSAPTGWALPFPVTTPDAARRLAVHSLGSAIAAIEDVVGAAPTGATLADVARWSARVQAVAVPWSLPLVPFPGSDA